MDCGETCCYKYGGLLEVRLAFYTMQIFTEGQHMYNYVYKFTDE